MANKKKNFLEDDSSKKENQKEGRVIEAEITKELETSYLDYAMSVIVARALPDVRDGLKPVHRRILWAMWESGLTHSAKYRKSANVVGEVLGRYHPHGDIAVYDALARMAQDFSLRYPLIDGQGNWGSVDGDSPAAMRYTECRLSKIAEELLVDIEKNTVDFVPNYDASRQEPVVLPAKIPHLLIFGSVGIAVGMATDIPPHNLGEVIDATLFLIKNPSATTAQLLNFIKGPDFPTGGIIYGGKKLQEAYATGQGSITCRAKAEIVERKLGQYNIVISEIPYRVNKSELIQKIAQLVAEKRIEGIKDLRDESDKEGLSIVIELKNDAAPQKVLNQLYKNTDLQKDFHLNMIALVNGIQPQLLSLKEILEHYLTHRQNVVRRRTEFDLARAKERAHILEGLAKALDNIDAVIATIKKSQDKEEAHRNLVAKFKLTDIQATAILEMKLQTLASLERKKIDDELKEKRRLIKEYEIILSSPQKILEVIEKELLEIKEKYADPRRTQVVEEQLTEFKDEDLIAQEETIITLSASGYIKRVNPSLFKVQGRGGRGIIASEVGEDDFLTHLILANTHDNILFFTDSGKVYQTKVYEIPQGSRVSKGKMIHNFLNISPSESIQALVAYDSKSSEAKYLIMATKEGIIKKTDLEEFSNVRRSGIIAINLRKGDSLKWVKLSSGNDEVIIVSAKGQSIRFKESQLRAMGRNASGVTGIKLKNGDAVVGMDIIKHSVGKELIGKQSLLVVSEKGFAKRTLLKEYKIQSRGGQGIKTAKITSKTGNLVACRIISEEEELIVLSAKGQVIKTKISDIRQSSRATSGVRVMKVKEGDKIVAITCV
ncbi:MAG: DNA gyrase subunit A [Candidatus Parcubacteria bacterium]|nr:DNA gyrase subunit A [Patescibacteria group bacterium]BCX15881.1 MAG: DNA gyrase subunit A [Candidatus Parcubacteria bacterium]